MKWGFNMKKLIALILSVSMLLGGASVFAAEYTKEADALNAMGLFKGTEKGYELDKTFTRAEGAAMIVRLLGKEKEALASSGSVKFTDVADHWSKPYVAYCAGHGITNGTSENKFSPDDKMSGAEYMTLVLRSIGYQNIEPGSVELAAPELYLGSSKEIRELLSGEFTRDKMVHVSYRALSVKDPKGKMLVSSLIESGAVSGTAAQSAGISLESENRYITP